MNKKLTEKNGEKKMGDKLRWGKIAWERKNNMGEKK